MTSMHDGPDMTHRDALRWPGADRRRHAQPGTVALDAAARAREGVDHEPALTLRPSYATPHDTAELDAAGLDKLHGIAQRAGVDPAAIGHTVHVARTRRGLIVMLTVYELDADGLPVHVLGVPVTRHVIRPVTVDELPAAWRRAGER